MKERGVALADGDEATVDLDPRRREIIRRLAEAYDAPTLAAALVLRLANEDGGASARDAYDLWLRLGGERA